MIWQRSSIRVARRSKDRLTLRAAGAAPKSGLVPQKPPAHMSKYYCELKWSDADVYLTNVETCPNEFWHNMEL